MLLMPDGAGLLLAAGSAPVRAFAWLLAFVPSWTNGTGKGKGKGKRKTDTQYCFYFKVKTLYQQAAILRSAQPSICHQFDIGGCTTQATFPYLRPKCPPTAPTLFTHSFRVLLSLSRVSFSLYSSSNRVHRPQICRGHDSGGERAAAARACGSGSGLQGACDGGPLVRERGGALR
jgi:hypothetical protein